MENVVARIVVLLIMTVMTRARTSPLVMLMYRLVSLTPHAPMKVAKRDTDGREKVGDSVYVLVFFKGGTILRAN